MKKFLCLYFLLINCCTFGLLAQEIQSKEYEIGGIKVSGAQFSDENAIISISGFKVGNKVRIPGTDVSRALKALWDLKLFTDVQIIEEKLVEEVIFLEIKVKERPRLAKYNYKTIKKSYHDDLDDLLETVLLRGAIVTENLKANAKRKINEFFVEKGFFDVTIDLEESAAPGTNRINLTFDIDRGKKVKINEIRFKNNNEFTDKKLRKTFEETHHKKSLFKSSKFIQNLYEEDKKLLINFYNNNGFRDAQIIKDSLWRNEDGELMIEISLEEGERYFFRNITWKGNSVYDTATLQKILGIEEGDVFNKELLETRLRFSQDGRDVSTLYLDNGYLFFKVDPVEVAVDSQYIDLEMRIYEGPQATIDKVTIAGNDRTHEHVIRRELRTIPGKKFSRSDIIRSQREIIGLGYFNPETLGINTPVNPQRGTVDIEYTVEEKPSDQLELSAGWGGRGRGVIGTVGISFNNFSLRNIANRKSWNPLPQGDGQRLSLRAQTNGKFFQSYNFSFTEPWLGGKKPRALTVGGFYSLITNGVDRNRPNHNRLSILNGSVGLGTRLRWPDDNFISNTTLNLQVLTLDNYVTGSFLDQNGRPITDGSYNNFSIQQTFARNSINDPLFPTTGSRFSLTVKLTPPYSLFNDKNYRGLDVQSKFQFLEYHKWRFDAEWFTQLAGKLVLRLRGKIGMVGFYNDEIGLSPFELYRVGGDGLANQQGGILGFDLISSRGYDESDFPASASGASVFDKFTVEFRYPISTNPNSTIYVLTFLEGANAWRSFRDFNPFDMRRSVGGGVRIFLPMFGTLGFDYGLGFDKENVNPNDSFFARYGTFNIVLGFEPE